LSILNSRISQPAVQFWLLAGFLVIVFFTGGASRADAQSLTVLRPVSIIICGIGLFSLRTEHLQGRKWLFWGFGCVFAITALYLIPVSNSPLRDSVGSDVQSTVSRITAFRDIWEPLTIMPLNGVNALMSLFTPVAVFILGVQLQRRDLYRLLSLILALGALSGVIGVLQTIGGSDSWLYLYRITNHGDAVGLFANRNHAAVFLACLFPLLAVYASAAGGSPDSQIRRQLIAGAMAVILVPLLLVTGSRSGLILSLVGLGGAALLYTKPDLGRAARRTGRMASFAPLLVGLALLSLAIATYLLARAEALERLFFSAQHGDLRQDFWFVSFDLFWQYFPLGSGPGSFATAYQPVEPLELLDASYLNRAHNDWIETAVTLGVPGLLLLSMAFAAYLGRNWVIWRTSEKSRQSVTFARMAGMGMAIIALASIVDYPLRTPSMMCVFAVFTLWLTGVNRNAYP
jgi:O-antigen ligase